jgi:sRNA-binding carbon storage regulator CsrA
MALVIKRLEGESVWVGDARITVERVGDRRVVLSIKAPDDVQIIRHELLVREHPDDPTLRD